MNKSVINSLIDLWLKDTVKETTLKTLPRLVVLAWSLGLANLSANEHLDIPGGEFIIVWESTFDKDEQHKIRAWLSHAANTTSLVNGKFPRRQTQIYIKRQHTANEPVPWAHTVRHTTPEGVKFRVNPSLSLDRFKADWTAPHEFSHLYIPYPGSEDIWISEGFATYYQNILMSRAGILSEKAAWQKIADGLSRGAKAKNPGMTLGELSAKMRHKRAFMRVYWSGVLYFLEADIALRRQGGSLDSIITEFIRCCRHKLSTWNGYLLVQSFDKIAGTSLFVPMFREYESEYQLRDYARILSQIGIKLDQGKIVFAENNDHKLLREKFTGVPL